MVFIRNLFQIFNKYEGIKCQTIVYEQSFASFVVFKPHRPSNSIWTATSALAIIGSKRQLPPKMKLSATIFFASDEFFVVVANCTCYVHEGFFPYYSAYLATAKTAAEMPPSLKLSTATFYLREFIQIARTATLIYYDVTTVGLYPDCVAGCSKINYCFVALVGSFLEVKCVLISSGNQAHLKNQADFVHQILKSIKRSHFLRVCRELWMKMRTQW